MKKDLRKLYPRLQDKIKITLIGGYRGVLSTYDEEVSHHVRFCWNQFHPD